MKPKEKIILAFDCGNEWEDMIPGKKGRLCESCNKEVVDFTSFTENELKQYFSERKTPVCGKYTDKQARVERKPIAELFRGFRLNTVAALTFLTTKLISFEVQAQDSSKVILADPENEKLKNHKKLYGDSAVFHIEGYVQRKGKRSRMRNINIEVLVEGKKSGFSASDDNGDFNLNIPLAHGGEAITLIFSRYRYKDVTINNYIPDGNPLVVKMRKKRYLRFRRRHVVGFMIKW